MLCNRCGHSIPAGSSVCPHCQADVQPSSMSSMRPTSLKPPSFSGGASSSSPAESPSQQPTSFQFSWNAPKQDDGTKAPQPTPSFQFSWNQPKPPPEPQAAPPPEPQAAPPPAPAPPPSVVPPVSPTMATTVRLSSTSKPRTNQDAPTTDLDPEKPTTDLNPEEPTTDLNPEEPTSDQQPEDDDDKPYAPAPSRPPRVLRPADDDAADVSDRPPRVLRPAKAVEYEEDDEPYALSENEPPARGMEDFAPQPAFQPADQGGPPPHASRFYLVWAILNLLCCANPLGFVCSIIALILHCKANLNFREGNIAVGMRQNDLTLLLNIIATILNVLLTIIAFSNGIIFVTP